MYFLFTYIFHIDSCSYFEVLYVEAIYLNYYMLLLNNAYVKIKLYNLSFLSFNLPKVI